jgi:hypothetical protein
MATVRKLRQQIFSGNITGAGGTITMDQEIDRNFKRVTSISVEVNDVRSLTGGTFDTPLSIDSQEVFTAGYELKRLFSTTSVEPKSRKYNINERANGAKLTFKYLDAGGFAITGAYSVKVYLDLSNDDRDDPAHPSFDPKRSDNF